jgi:uracil-DNA glycosylase family 4
MSQCKKSLLEALEEKIKNCKNCELCKTALNAVPGTGNFDAEIVFIGEAPGAKEDEEGLPFIGRSGALLNKNLEKIGLKRTEIWIGNIIKHRPPKNRDPKKSEIEACSKFLKKQLEIIDPLLIVTLGRFAFNYFVPEKTITKEHGKLVKDTYSLFPIYHPSAALRNSKFRAVFEEDFSKIPLIVQDLKKEIND